MPRIVLIAAFVIATLFAWPVHAQTAAATTPAAPEVAADADAPTEARIAKMRERWKKMTPEQREDMRKKADRRLQERFERLSPQQQTQVTGMVDQIEKLDHEERSIVLARIHQKFYQERMQKKAMKDQEGKGAPAPAPAAAAPAAAPAVVTPAPAVATPKPPAPAPAAAPKPASH